MAADDCDDLDDALGAEALDADCDGVQTIPDCDDSDSSVGADPDDGDCDGIPTLDDCDDNDPDSTVVAEDADCDGVLSAEDCNDHVATLGAQSTDADCDGSVAAEDCDDSNAAVAPMAGDIFGNGLDGDCDGLHCQAGSSGGSYFAVCPMSRTWADADATCQAAGYDGLATILNSTESAYIGTLTAPITGWHFWIGYTDMDIENTWLWTSGLSALFTNWASTQPAGAGDCAWLAGADYPLGANGWFDGACATSSLGTSTIGFVCESR
ncbi:MAG TPA: hypothetical protein DIU15_13735 [Deltaproteobacteria bacterium]|nr:hypothetical protein [Deltaproteobacteria bacterium]